MVTAQVIQVITRETFVNPQCEISTKIQVSFKFPLRYALYEVVYFHNQWIAQKLHQKKYITINFDTLVRKIRPIVRNSSALIYTDVCLTDWSGPFYDTMAFVALENVTEK